MVSNVTKFTENIVVTQNEDSVELSDCNRQKTIFHKVEQHFVRYIIFFSRSFLYKNSDRMILSSTVKKNKRQKSSFSSTERSS